jgi:hypothetical protein
MKSFFYSSWHKIIYWFANYIVTFLLFLHSIYLLFFENIEKTIYFFVIYSIIIYLINRNYFKRYRLFPTIIETDNEFLIAKRYWKGENRKILIKDIENITGNVFDFNPNKPLYIKIANSEEVIGIYSGIKDFENLFKIILSNINASLYKELIDKLTRKKAP